eukprot:386622_1
MSTQNTLFMLVIGAVLFFFSGFALKHVVGPTCTGGGTETPEEYAALKSNFNANVEEIRRLTSELRAAKDRSVALNVKIADYDEENKRLQSTNVDLTVEIIEHLRLISGQESTIRQLTDPEHALEIAVEAKAEAEAKVKAKVKAEAEVKAKAEDEAKDNGKNLAANVNAISQTVAPGAVTASKVTK